MPLTVLALISLFQADDPLKVLRERLEKAETIRIEFEDGVVGLEPLATRGRLLLKGRNRVHLREEAGFAGHVHRREYCFDGRRLAARRMDRFGDAPVADPARLTRARELLALLSLSQATRSVLLNSAKAPEIGVSELKHEGLRTIDGRPRCVVTYVLPGQKIELHLDPRTGLPLERILRIGGDILRERYTAFVLDEDLPDAAFVYATKARLAEAQAAQLARSIELHQRFTGLAPASLEALGTRPEGLDASVFWPDGGFVLGGRAPRDPWGRPFELRVSSVVSLGADGGPGGTGDAADVSAPVAPPAGDRIAPPTERLKRHYAARLTLHLVKAAARAYEEAYAETPDGRWNPPEGIVLEPPGGWLPGGELPKDPWGNPLEFRTGHGLAVVRVRDAAMRRVRTSDLSDEEVRALEAGMRPWPLPQTVAELKALLAALSGEDPDGRERAEAELRGRLESAPGLLDAPIWEARDPEAESRLERIRAGIKRPLPAWREELAPLVARVDDKPNSAGSLHRVRNEREAEATLRMLVKAQDDFSKSDRDGNGVKDFWTGDVAGLFALTVDGRKIAMINLATALADAAPLTPGDAMGRIEALEGARAPNEGYLFQAMRADGSATPKEPYAQDTQGTPNLGNFFNRSKYGFCAFPSDYGITGTKTYIIDEKHGVYWTDTCGEPVLEWPDPSTLKTEWTRG